MKKLILTLLVVLTTTAAWAVKAFPGLLTTTQKDGTQLNYRLYGDADFHYNTTADGVLLYQVGSDYYIAGVNSNGELYNTNVLAHNAGNRTAEEQVLIKQQDRSKFFAQADRTVQKIRLKEPVAPNKALFQHSGSPKALIILADFTDQAFKHDDQTTKEIFDQYLNAEEGVPTHKDDETLSKNYGSVKQYFKEMSYGLFTPIFDVAAVVHLTHDMKYYGEETGSSHDKNLDQFIKDACTAAHNQGVNFANYDANNDGNVDLVYIIFAGYGQSMGADSNTIWPCSNSGNYGTYDGKTVCRFGVHNELNFTPSTTESMFGGEAQINGIGLFCHEFSHCMGLPDLYPTTATAQNNGNPGMENWSLMDGGEYTDVGYCPTAYTAWEREAFEWFEIETLTDDMKGTITLKNIDEGGKAYRIYPDGKSSGNEYVIIQNIQPYRWNTSLASNVGHFKQYGYCNWGHGMLITHVDYNASAFAIVNGTNSVNNTTGHSRMTIVPADGEYISYYKVQDSSHPDRPYTRTEYRNSHRADPYPGTKNVTEIASISVYNGTMVKPFYNIQETNGVITFDFLENTSTAISTVKVDEGKTNNRIYTIDGRLVNTAKDQLPKGIYIIGNKKVVIK